jgi:hypothetical protein
MSSADRLTWTIARQVAGIPGGTVFAASFCAIAGIRLAQELLRCRLSLCGRGGAYDVAGILSLHARHWLYNRRPHAHVSLARVFETLSEPHALLTTPAQVDGFGNANLSALGTHTRPQVAFGGTRGLPDARTVHFVLPSHNARQLVERVDFVSTAAARREQPPLLITELCVMRWDVAAGSWSLEQIAPEISVEALQARTGFRFVVCDALTELEAPSAQVCARLADIDPFGLREVDLAGGRKSQLDAISRVYEREAALVGEHLIPARQRANSDDHCAA